MEKVTVLPPEKMINGWIDPIYLPEGKDRYYLRNRQAHKPKGGWRHLTSDEIERLVKNDNTAFSWDTIWVTDEFEPRLIKNNKFYGTVRIGRVTDNGLRFHDLRLPIGISNSSIHSCDIGDDCAIHNVHYLSHYIIGNRCMLFNIEEMCTTDHSKFGNGVIKDGEPEDVRVKIEIMNETGCRAVYPFDGMITADAYMWAKYIDDEPLQQKLREMTQASVDSHRGYYGTVGEGCVIKNSSIIKDAKIGAACYIKGASKLKNITINSSEKEPSQIGENVILVNGILVHPRCRRCQRQPAFFLLPVRQPRRSRRLRLGQLPEHERRHADRCLLHLDASPDRCLRPGRLRLERRDLPDALRP